MKRRNFVMSGYGAAALGAGLGWAGRAGAGVSQAQASLLKTTLTPVGAERAGNADNSIPAWTGGETTPPSGWTPSQLMPDLFGSDAKLFSVNAANMAQYQNQLSIGVQALMQKYPDYRIDVFPTRRSAAAPQWVYDNIYQNALNAALDPRGGRYGFVGAYGGIPFPIPDPDPLKAGAQIIWNHICQWKGEFSKLYQGGYLMTAGSMTELAGAIFTAEYPFYQKDGSLADYQGYIMRSYDETIAPPNDQGQNFVNWGSGNELVKPTIIWEYLSGQGRVRKAPELLYDTPASQVNGIMNDDELFMYNPPPNRYDWKLIGKQEILIPYNNNKFLLSDPKVAMQQHFINPDLLRWEKHRVWVVDATLHPGERHVEPHRRFYLDEDTWAVTLTEAWDAQGNLWKTQMFANHNRPDLPGNLYGNTLCYNFQEAVYLAQVGQWGIAPWNTPPDFTTRPSPELFVAENMAAQSAF